MNYEETYIVHNCMMEMTHRELNELGRPDLAQRLQSMAQDEDGAFILHSLIAKVIEICQLDAETEGQIAFRK